MHRESLIFLSTLLALWTLPSMAAEKRHIETDSKTETRNESTTKPWADIELRVVQNDALLRLEDVFNKQFSEKEKLKGIVLFNMSTGCPKARYRLPEIKKIVDDYRKKGIQVLGINGFDADAIPDILTHASDKELNFPILYDPGQKMISALGIKRINEVLLLDPKLNIQYRGDIHDGFGPHGPKSKIENAYLRNALDSLLQGKEVAVKRTTVDGCELSHVPDEKIPGLTYCKDIAPIIKAKCQSCHIDGGAAPFSLTDMESAKDWAEMIKTVVSERRMPPWNADKAHYPKGGFSNDRSLSEGEVQKIVSWMESKEKLEGDKAQCPTPLTKNEGWEIGEPDLIIDSGVAFEVPEDGEVDYQYFQAKLPKNIQVKKLQVKIPERFKNRLWIEKSEIRPGNTEIVHHAIAHITGPTGMETNLLNFAQKGPEVLQVYMNLPPDKREPFIPWANKLSKISSLYDPKTAAVSGSYVPGEGTRTFLKGYATPLPLDGTLNFEMHFTANGSKSKDLSPSKDGKPGHTTQIGFKFTDKPQKAVLTNPLGKVVLRVPAGEPNFRAEQTFKFEKDSEILFLQPHMHKLGKDFRYVVEFPDGRKETVLSVPKWDYRWQSEYRFKEPFKVPKGSTLHVIAHYDNSAMNPNNPNSPPKDVAWGFSTSEEMMNGWLGYAVDEPLEKAK